LLEIIFVGIMRGHKENSIQEHNVLRHHPCY